MADLDERTSIVMYEDTRVPTPPKINFVPLLEEHKTPCFISFHLLDFSISELMLQGHEFHQTFP